MSILDQYGNPYASTRPTESIQEQPSTQAPEYPASGKTETQASVADLHPLTPSKTRKKPDENHDSPQSHKRDWFDKTNLAIQGLLLLSATGAFLAALWYADTAERQKNSTDMQLGTMLEQVRAAQNANQLASENSEASDRQSRAALIETRRSNGINRESLVSVQRAFIVYRQSPTNDPIIDPATNNATAWEFRLIIENTGTTPTRSLTHHANLLEQPDDLPTNFGFPDTGGIHPPPKFVVGPKDTAALGALQVSVEKLALVQSRKARLYFWAWTRYRDIFENTPEHVSMFCTEITDIRGDLVRLSKVAFAYQACRIHNCSDEDCKGEKGDPRIRERQPVTPSQ